MVYSWALDRMSGAKPEDFEAWHEELFAPPDGIDPDHVTQQVVEDEMSLFHSFARQTGSGGN